MVGPDDDEIHDFLDDVMASITIDQLYRATAIALPFYQTLGGKDGKDVCVAVGLLLRAVIEEGMKDPHDDEERTTRMQEAFALAQSAMMHPAVKRKAMTQ